jgi:hypothetical protein
MKARDVTVCLPNSPSPLTQSVVSVTHAGGMELNPTENVQNFPLATLNTAVDKSPFGSRFQYQDKTPLPRVFTGPFARPSKPCPRFEKGSLIDIYA